MHLLDDVRSIESEKLAPPIVCMFANSSARTARPANQEFIDS